MSKPNQRSASYLFIRIAMTFCCFIVALMVLWYWGMGGDLSSMQKFVFSKGGLSSLNDAPPALFYQAIGGGTNLNNSEPSKTVNNMFTLELQVVTSRLQADRMISDLMKRGVRAFYTEHAHQDGKKTFSIRRGLYSSLEEAQSASHILLAQRSIHNRVVELSP